MAPEVEAQSGAQWLPVTVAASRLGVSARAIQKRCASGTLAARRVAGTRGQVWEVEADALRANANANLKANTNPVRREVRPQLPLPASNEREGRTLESERERELKDEVRFLRGLVEQLQRDGAETRQHLKRALDLAPKQLAAPAQGATVAPSKPAQVLTVNTSNPDETAISGQQRDENSETGRNSQQPLIGARIEQDGEETGVSYASIADELERMWNQ